MAELQWHRPDFGERREQVLPLPTLAKGEDCSPMSIYTIASYSRDSERDIESESRSFLQLVTAHFQTNTINILDSSTSFYVESITKYLRSLNLIFYSNSGNALLRGGSLMAGRAGTLICRRDGDYQSIAPSPNGRYIAILSNNRVTMLDITTCNDIFAYSNSQSITQVVWSPDGQWLALSGDRDTFEIHNPNTPGHGSHHQGHFFDIKKVTWAFDSRHIASIDIENIMHVWDTDTGYVIKPKWENVLNVTWSPNRQRLAVVYENQISIYDTNNLNVNSKNAIANIKFNDIMRSYTPQDIIWSPNSRFLACCLSSGEQGSEIQVVRVWDIETRRMVFKCDGTNMSWSPPDGKLIALWKTYESKVQIWDFTTRKIIHTYEGHIGDITSIAWSPDGQRIASGSRDKRVQVWDAANGEWMFPYSKHTSEVTSVFYSPDGMSIISFSQGPNGSIHVWTARSA